jgi:glycosyltransferase involved in cell wall biosynthesis
MDDSTVTSNIRIAVIIPCLNEEGTVGRVVADFRAALPDAVVYVCDNASADSTSARASEAGAVVVREHRRGKGAAVRRMFRDVDADLYVMVDGDGTYPAGSVYDLIRPVAEGRADMCVGTRLARFESGSFRVFHRFGNSLIRDTINILFGCRLSDVLSGYRCFSRRFVKSIPLLSVGFEVETELTLQALDKDFPVEEITVDYFKRPDGSFSKLNTYSDGALVLKTIFRIFKDYKPLKFFTASGVIFLLTGLALGAIPIAEFMRTGLVLHFPTAILAVGFVITSLFSFSTGLILDTINRRHRELHRLIADATSAGPPGSTGGQIREHAHEHTHGHVPDHTHEHTHEHPHEHVPEHAHEHVPDHTHEGIHGHPHEHSHEHIHDHAHEHAPGDTPGHTHSHTGLGT